MQIFAFIVIYNLPKWKMWCVVHASSAKAAGEYINTHIPGAKVTNVRGPVKEFRTDEVPVYATV